jgi:hypothetical protein
MTILPAHSNRDTHMAPDVTVIVPAWNAANYIEKAVASALVQNGPMIQVVIADDASTDNTPEVVGRIADARVDIVRLPINGGPSAARNAALAVARGRWIAVLDADDAMLPDRLQDLIRTAEANALDIISDNMWVEDASGTRKLLLDEKLDGSVQRYDFGDYVRRNLLFARGRGDGYLKPMFRAAFLHQTGLRYDPAIWAAAVGRLRLHGTGRIDLTSTCRNTGAGDDRGGPALSGRAWKIADPTGTGGYAPASGKAARRLQFHRHGGCDQGGRDTHICPRSNAASYCDSPLHDAGQGPSGTIGCGALSRPGR